MTTDDDRLLCVYERDLARIDSLLDSIRLGKPVKSTDTATGETKYLNMMEIVELIQDQLFLITMNDFTTQ